jgi:hypothetical protein
MDAGCTPRGILPAHLADQRSDLGRNDGSSGFAAAHLPGPEQAKSGTMPGNDLCLAKIKSAFEINNIKKRDVTMLHAMWLGEITIRHRQE